MSIRRIAVKNSLALRMATTPQCGMPFTAVPNREDAVIYRVNMRAFS